MVERASPGDRCALNITGLDLDEVQRGDWVTEQHTPHMIETTISLRVLGDFPRRVKHWTPVHIYHATSHSTGRIGLLSNERVGPGETALVDVVCDEPLAVRHGDQLVLRDQSLDVTLGGGRVVHGSSQPTLRRRAAARLQTLRAYDTDTPEVCLAALLKSGHTQTTTFRDTWQLDDAEVARLVQEQDARLHEQLAITNGYWAKLSDAIYGALESHQKNNPSSQGVRENAINVKPTALRGAILNELVQAKRLEVGGGLYRLPNTEAELPEELAAAWTRIESALDQLQAPSTGDLSKQWHEPQAHIEAQLKELTKRKLVVHVATHRYYLPSRLNEIAAIVTRLCQQAPLSVRAFRDETGIGRNVAIEVLEYFDGRGFTRRQGNERIVLRDSLGR